MNLNFRSEVFNYSDYRTYLKSYVSLRRAESTSWSYGAWAKKLGAGNTSVIANVINGHRSPGRSLTEKLTEYFKFDERQSDYFKDLIRLEKVSDDPQLTVMVMEKLGQEHPSGRFQLLDEESFSTISNWYYYAIREMTFLADFSSDPKWISMKLKSRVGVREVKKAISHMLSLGLLERISDGSLKSTSKNVRSSDGVAREALKKFHEGMLDRAKESLRDLSVDERDITNVTMPVKNSDMKAAKEYIKKFRRNFVRVFENTSESKNVFQLNIQFFPLTQEMGEQDER